MKDPYSVLGVSRNATPEEIKSAYRRLAKQYHPDVNNGDKNAEQKMKELNEAYSVLIKGSGKSRSSGYGSDWAGDYGASSNDERSQRFRAVRNYIAAGHYREAMHLLSEIDERNAQWYYLHGVVNFNLGNRVAAMESARIAVNMEPANPEYQMLLSRLQGNGAFYRNMASGNGYNMGNNVCMSPGLQCCLCSLLLSGCGCPVFIPCWC